MTRRRRVVAFTPGHQEMGGLAQHSRLLCEELARRQWDVRVVTRSGTSTSFSVRRAENLLVVEVPRCGGTLRGALAFMVVALLLGGWWSLRAQALLAVQLSSPSIAAAILGRLTKHPFVALSTTSGMLSEAGFVMQGSSASWLRSRLLRGAACIVAQTELGKRELTGLLPDDHLAVLPTPVERVEDWPLDGQPRVLFSGRFSEEKALPVLLRAWEEVVRSYPEAKLVLAGAGGAYRSVEPDLRATVEGSQSLSDTVDFVGWVRDVPRLLRSHDIYVFPSMSEGMSNSLVEACAAGRAVVASDIPPNVAVLGEDYPLLFPVGDHEALAQRLLSALQEPDVRAQAAARARERARAMLLPEVGARLEGLLCDAADRPRP